MITPKLIKVVFEFEDGFKVTTIAPFEIWTVWKFKNIVGSFRRQGRKDVTKHGAIRVLKKALDIMPKKGSRMREIYDKLRAEGRI